MSTIFINSFVFGGGAANWWEAGGATGAVAVYQPKGAADLAASYVNLANPGTNDAAPGTAPTWNATDGWIFSAASSQYLATGITPLLTYSMIIRFSDVTNTNCCIAGALGTGNKRFHLFPVNSLNASALYGYDLNYARSPAITAGTLAITQQRGYRNGSADGADFSAPVGNNDAVLDIGRRSDGFLYTSGYVQAIAIYSSTLTADQVAAVSAAMAAL